LRRAALGRPFRAPVTVGGRPFLADIEVPAAPTWFIEVTEYDVDRK
jgi:hypothetical protein